jgi:phosphate transport system permease protein
MMMGFALIIILLMSAMFIELVRSSWLSIRQFGGGFLFTRTWDPVFEHFGALPFIYGTLVTSFVALLIAVPVGVGCAIYLAEYAPGWLRKSMSLLVDLLAAIPSVVYGLWAIFELVPLMRVHIQPFLGKYFGFLPFFQGPNYGVGFLAASVVLAIMIVPFIISVSREVMLAVPQVYKEAAYALGSTRWEAVSQIILSYGKSGILGGIILALGRAIGETMAVTMIIGNNVTMSASLFSPGYTLASVIANEFTEATGDLYLAALMNIGLVLFLVSILVNVLARVLIWSVSQKQSSPKTKLQIV